MPNRNEPSHPIPSPSEVMNRFGNEVLNNKNLAAIDEIAAEDYVELNLLPGQAPGREGLKAFLARVLFPAFPDQQWVTESRLPRVTKSCPGSRCTERTEPPSWESQQPEDT